ncbi:peptide/nickel transport system ATP-binding protein [Tindallia magadiensis]|uniref:Peptide/nickel transport system ATP-binding protein n=1 Tax=Tindallia magadiensis TaxID=69895 RepID=A0A1I3GUC1_9FIRM|nr:ATP-binding cassette domain-containing protein [Tindallia magadiensis]SFI27013.1 peptide/nickel transport system ATP-binding protein [Tindallia magadiensis]
MLELRKVTKSYGRGWPFSQKITPVKEVSFSVYPQKTTGLVGKSGCGKSTLARCITGLQPIDSGHILYQDVSLNRLSFRDWLPYRRKIQMVFQHPDTALNPKKKILESLKEPFRLHRILPEREAVQKIRESLAFFGLTEDILFRYPHQVSGGQIQRVALLRALSLQPELLVLDEPTSMLDVSVQAQMIQLLQKIQQEFSLSMLFISHDIHLIKAISDQVLIMKEGRILEQGSTESIFSNPIHPETKKIADSLRVGLF